MEPEGSLPRSQEPSTETGSTQPREFNGCGDPLRWRRDTLYPQKLELRRQAAVAR
jgi:hypothetical protein